MINILILIDCSPGFSRRFLGGLSRYSNENGPWNLYYLTPYYKNLSGEGGILQRIREQHIDAVIVQWEYEDFGFLEKLD
ncbi:MAG TPA: transcriptional regulator, partial [Porphyromonadaceae bacterium]|nr:transcriptional regulator [Porphyromonadaceae bacterium]